MKKVVPLVFLLLAGCSMRPQTAPDEGKQYVQNSSQSWAWNVTAYAGYPGLISDNKYSSTLDTAIKSTSNALLLPTSLTSMSGLAAGSLGVGLGLVGSLAGQWPLEGAGVVTTPLQAGEQYNDPAMIARAIKANFNLREYKESASTNLKPLLLTKSLDKLVCIPAKHNGFNHDCYVPGYEDYPVFVKAVRPADGTEFGSMLGLDKGRYAVLTVANDRGSLLRKKADSPDPVLMLVKNTYVVRDNILPFIGPNDQGKRLVFLDGKASLL